MGIYFPGKMWDSSEEKTNNGEGTQPFFIKTQALPSGQIKEGSESMTEGSNSLWAQLSRGELEQTSGDREGQGSLACCSPWGHRVRHNLVIKQQLRRKNRN